MVWGQRQDLQRDLGTHPCPWSLGVLLPGVLSSWHPHGSPLTPLFNVMLSSWAVFKSTLSLSLPFLGFISPIALSRIWQHGVHLTVFVSWLFGFCLWHVSSLKKGTNVWHRIGLNSFAKWISCEGGLSGSRSSFPLWNYADEVRTQLVDLIASCRTLLKGHPCFRACNCIPDLLLPLWNPAFLIASHSPEKFLHVRSLSLSLFPAESSQLGAIFCSHSISMYSILHIGLQCDLVYIELCIGLWNWTPLSILSPFMELYGVKLDQQKSIN